MQIWWEVGVVAQEAPSRVLARWAATSPVAEDPTTGPRLSLGLGLSQEIKDRLAQ